jgi:hypothetical protein
MMRYWANLAAVGCALLFGSVGCRLASSAPPPLSCSAPELRSCEACLDRGCGWCPARGSAGVCCRSDATCPSVISELASCPAIDPCTVQATCQACQDNGCFWCPQLGCLPPLNDGRPPQCQDRVDPADECSP